MHEQKFKESEYITGTGTYAIYMLHNNKVRIQFFSELDKLTLVVELGGWEGRAPEVWILVLSSPHGS